MYEIETTVKEVTVYVDRARICRKGCVSLAVGSHYLTITGLPVTLLPDSVRAKAVGTARARILGVDLRRVFFKDVPPGKAKELTDLIRQLEDKEQVLVDNSESLNGQVKHIDGVADSAKTYAVSLAKGSATPESHGKIIDFLTEKRMAAQAKLRQNEIERRELSREIEKLKNELKQVQDLKPAQRYSAVIETDVTGEGELEIELLYTMPGVTWKPIYDIRLWDEKMEIHYLGQVNQKTGEDWDDVKLVLSTVPPASGMQVPELDPWYISPLVIPVAAPPIKRRAQAAARPAPSYGEAGDGMAGAAMMAEAPEEAEPEIEEALYATAAVERSGASVTYTLGNKVYIPGGGSPHKAMIAHLELTPGTDFVTAPRKECSAYRRVKAVNNSELMLLPGLAQVFENEDYIGNASLKLVAPGAKVKIYAGTDERIRVERKLVSREVDKKLLADKRRINYAYEIKLENHTGKEQRIFVRDQVPLPRHEDIKVKFEGARPKVAEKDGMNRIKWEITLPDKEKKSIVYEFSIEYPRNMQVVGLP
ncbi:MAG: mucoidy inhibitor MuiA family protein [Candidatus Aminicenantes bacterium]|nr:mucoidy inhibitor MuiA family protein [Candidatus Aminicenantes bacterium]